MQEIHAQMARAARQRERSVRARRSARTAFGHVTLITLIISILGCLVFSQDPSTQKMWGILVVYSPLVGAFYALINYFATVSTPIHEPADDASDIHDR